MNQQQVRVLAVEDDREDYELIRELLDEVEGTCFEVAWAPSCAAGLAALAGERYDVILLDCRLGDETGLDFILRMPLEDQTPIILLTGDSARETDLKAMKAGAADFLAKDEITPIVLERSIRYAVEQARSREAKQEAELRYRVLVESAGAIVWQADPETFEFSLVSREAEAILGYPVERWLEDPGFWPDRIHPEDRKWVLDYCMATSARGEPHAMEYRMIAADGSVVWLRDIVRIVPFGGRRQLVGVMVDISDQKEQEQALRESEARFRQFTEAVPQVFWIEALQDGELVYLSPAYERIWGRGVADALADPRCWREAIHPEDHGRVLPTAARRGEEGYAQEYRIVRSDGAVRWIREQGYPIRGGSGKHRIAGIAEDITEQRQAARAVEESEARFRSLAESANAAIFVTDEASTITFANAAAERIFGYAADVLVGESITTLIPEDMRARHLEGIRRYLANGTRSIRWDGLELPGLARDGRTVPLEITLGTFQLAGRHYFTGIAHDISERKQAEAEQRVLHEQLRQAHKMEAVGRLAGGVAHDFNNILTAIGGVAQLAREEVGEGRLRDDLDEVIAAAERAATLTRQLLAFSRQQVLQPAVLDLNAVVQDVGRMLRRLINEDIELIMVPGADLGRIEADRGALEQVLMNLVVNARDAMPDGGRLTIETANAQLTEEDAREYPYTVRPGAYVRFRVSDTGHGMDPPTLEHIFEPFFTTKEPGKGTGLGLATAYGIVKQSGGYVWVDSHPGEGTTFDIYLPRVEKSLPVAAPAPVTPGRTGGGETVLIVEDESAVRNLARRVLEKNGYHVLEACGPDEALRDVLPAGAGTLDLMITDVVMPGMNGRELAELARRARPGLRVIFMSGYTEDEVARRGIVDAGPRFLPKPFTPAELARSVREALDAAAP